MSGNPSAAFILSGPFRSDRLDDPFKVGGSGGQMDKSEYGEPEGGTV